MAYIHKMFGAIPICSSSRQCRAATDTHRLCITYVVGYVLGMLARYFPTHWVSVAQGNKGDSLWPTLKPELNNLSKRRS